MKWLCVFCLAMASCSVLQNNTRLQKEVRSLNDAVFVYSLPFEKGTAHFVVQGCFSLFSHYGDCAVDFKVKRGTKIFAARSGVVTFARENNTEGGISKKFVGKGNGITIKHSDGTYAHYWHLQYNGALVNVGDSVAEGQHIAYSGSTGFSAFPHLHFEVTKQPRISRNDMPVFFRTKKGAQLLQPLRRYKSI